MPSRENLDNSPHFQPDARLLESNGIERRGWAGSIISSFFLLFPIVVLALCATFLVSPAGDFPLNDDWIFAKEVETLLTTGRYVASPFSAPMVVAQTLWGTAFAAVFGFSYSVLRASTLVLAVMAAWATAKSAREMGAPPLTSVLAGMTLFCGPIFLTLAYSYNTDVPFLAPLAWSIFFFLRALRGDRIRSWDVFLGSALAAAAFFIRQFGLLVVVAFALTLIVDSKRGEWLKSRTALAALAGPWLLAAAAAVYLNLSSETHYTWTPNVYQQTLHDWMRDNWKYFIQLVAYVGLFTIPLTIPRLIQAMRHRQWTRREWIDFLAGSLVLGVTLHSLVGRQILPMLGNYLRDFGTGVTSLRSVNLPVDLDWQVVHLGDSWWTVITVLAVVSASVIFKEILSAVIIPEPPRRIARRRFLFLALCGILFCCVLLLPYMPGHSDRYVLPAVIPAAIVAAASWKTSGNKNLVTYVISMLLCALFLVFSLVCVHDYMAWNRARWTAIHWLLDEKRVDPLKIDAGYEYQGVYTSAEYMKRNDSQGFWDAGNWWLLDDTYAVSFTPRNGHDEIGRVAYYSYLGRIEPGTDVPWYRKGKRYVLILQRAGRGDE
ncbi:MAG: glycosyltransferase family 39 protein [Candidatus Hydrogenedentes bacterium]|nr:glycosyltransferase family 39 protein [Candidatus Hydrogenedentota bacterium]